MSKIFYFGNRYYNNDTKLNERGILKQSATNGIGSQKKGNGLFFENLMKMMNNFKNEINYTDTFTHFLFKYDL